MTTDNISEYEIAILIAKYIADNITEEELTQLEEWKSSSSENFALFSRLIDPENFNKLEQMASQYDENTAWNTIRGKMQKSSGIPLRRWIYYAAAAVILPLLCFYFIENNKKTIPSIQEFIMAMDNDIISPGSSKAILILGNGSVLELDEQQTFDIEEQEGTKIKKEASVLNYESQKDSKEIVYNQIYVPKGGEHSLILSDGSKVYLNSMSSLRYPVNFLTDIRTVELTGEAYFEVKKSDKAFIVVTRDAEIKVLGTSFNVSSYEDDNVVRTTLVEGSVRVNLKEESKELTLMPSEQVSFDRSKKEFSVRTVDVTSYIAWKDGLFYFKDWKLEEIFKYMSRWYNFDVTYENEEIKDYRFGGKFSRYEDLQPVLNLLEKTEKVKINVDENTIVLRKKK